MIASEVNRLTSAACGTAVATRTYDDVTFIVDSASLDTSLASCPLIVRVYLSPDASVPDLEFIAPPGETQERSLPPGQRYNLRTTSYSMLWND